MNIESLVDKTLEDTDSLKLNMELDDIHKNLSHRYNITANILNVANFVLKIAASIVILFFFVRAHYIDKVRYDKLDKHQLITYYFKLTPV